MHPENMHLFHGNILYARARHELAVYENLSYNEIAEQEGISLSYDLSYQGSHTPVDGESVSTRYHLPHTNRLTETQPKVWARYDYRLEPGEGPV